MFYIVPHPLFGRPRFLLTPTYPAPEWKDRQEYNGHLSLATNLRTIFYRKALMLDVIFDTKVQTLSIFTSHWWGRLGLGNISVDRVQVQGLVQGILL